MTPAGQRWTRSTPTEPGFYWWRRSVGYHKVLKVYDRAGLCVANGDDDLPIAEIYGGEWQGPLTPNEATE